MSPPERWGCRTAFITSPFTASLVRIQRSRRPVATMLPEGDHATAPALVASAPGFGSTHTVCGDPCADATPAVVRRSNSEAETSANMRRTDQVNMASLLVNRLNTQTD
jgi:hypothetical protein